MDDLADVVLQNKKLCSDNPQNWVVCESLQNAKNVFDWWETLANIDNAATSTMRIDQINRLRELRDQYDAIEDYNSMFGKQESRKILCKIFEEGLSIEQAGILCGISSVAVVRSLMTSRNINDKEAEERIKAETFLRQKIAVKEICKQLSLTIDEIRNWAKTLKIKIPVRNRYGEAFDPQVRERAMELYDTGLRGTEICGILQKEMPQEASRLTPRLIGQWATRSGRTKGN